MIRDAERRSDRLDRRLAELSRQRAEIGSREREPDSPKPYRRPRRITAATRVPRRDESGEVRFETVPLEEIVPGQEIVNAQGTVFLHEQFRSQIEPRRVHWGRLESGGRTRVPKSPSWEWEPGTEVPGEELTWFPEDEAGFAVPSAEAAVTTLAPGVLHAEFETLRRIGLGRALFLDLETCGLSQATVFLAGTMRWTGEDFVLHQFLARDYTEEPALLAAVAAEIAQSEAVITFNGKAFDLPLLRDRATAHRLPFPTAPLSVDLLHHARARWRETLPDCRLVTIEAWLCGRRRSGDIPGSEIPSVYHHFVRTGDSYRLIPVLHHNMLDVTTMEEILRALVD